MKLWRLVLYFCVLFWSCSLAERKARLYKFIQKSVRCSDFDPRQIINMTCKIRAVRGKLGLLDLSWAYNNVNDAYMEIKVFYRPVYRAQHNQPYVVDIDIELCPTPFIILNPLSLVFVTAFRTIDKGTLTCPMHREVSLIGFDLNDFISQFEIPYLPEGLFTGVYRMHDKKNRTLYTVFHTSQIKAEGAHDLSMLG